MASYKWYTVRFPIEEGGALDKRVQAYCKAAGLEGCEQTVIDNAAVTGIVNHINSNLAQMERLLPESGKV